MNKNWVGVCVKVEEDLIVFQMGSEVYSLAADEKVKKGALKEVAEQVKVGTFYILDLYPNLLGINMISDIFGETIIYDGTVV